LPPYAMAGGLAMDAELQAKAQQKCEFVQTMIRRIERALNNNGEEDRQWLRTIIDPNDPCLKTLILLLIEPKYRGFVSLRCVVLRAVQLILRIASNLVKGPPASDANVGMWCLVHLVGDELASEAVPEVIRMAERDQSEPIAACNALLMLAELGPEALTPDLAPRLVDLFVRLPDRADDLVEVALRFHAQGGAQRAALLHAAVSRPGGSLLCEVLLQVVNRADVKRRLRALKVLSGCLAKPSSESLLYTNDVRVLVEILLRELPNSVEDSVAFACHAECFKALAARCSAAREHRRTEALQVFGDLYEDQQNEPKVREKCAEVLTVMAQAGA